MLAASAATAAALVFAVVASSAWLRLAPAVPCPPAGCEGFTLADGVRLAHRVAAMAVSAVALLIAWLAWERRPASPLLRATAIAIVVLVAALAVLGRSSAGTPSPLVALGNLVGGMTLLGACVALACAGTLASPPRTGRLHGPTAAATGLVGLAIVLGACLGAASPALPAGVQSAHLAAGWILPIAWAGLAGRPGAEPGARRASAATAVLLVAETALATLGPVRADSPFAAWLHNGLAAAALCAAIVALARSRA
jgi:hypothetical protein